MIPTSKPLFSLTAADIMSASPVVLHENMSLKGAARRLVEAAVTGAPVVNSEGRCVGVLSATDFVHRMQREHGGPAACAVSPAFCAPWQLEQSETEPDEAVHDHMTRGPVTVAAAATLGQLALMMIDGHIHRLIVTDKDNKPVGVVSAIDVLAAVARAHQAAMTASTIKETAAC
jgi:CBS domain-containing protein